MASLLFQTIEQISREKHIEPEVIVAAIEDAMVVAARKYYRTEEDLRSKFNPDTGHVDVFSVHTVVEEVADPLKEISLAEARKQNPEIEVGGEITANKPTEVLGRIAAQTAKQVILQKVREAERDTIYNEYHTRVGELINAVVKRIEGPDMIVDMGRTEARLPKREQSRLEAYNVGDRRGKSGKRPAGSGFPRRSSSRSAAFRNGSARNLRWYGTDSGRRARVRRTHQNRSRKPR
jgi:transcription termination/antitermination protein NusA